jgi:hypothetical protein
MDEPKLFNEKVWRLEDILSGVNKALECVYAYLGRNSSDNMEDVASLLEEVSKRLNTERQRERQSGQSEQK